MTTSETKAVREMVANALKSGDLYQEPLGSWKLKPEALDAFQAAGIMFDEPAGVSDAMVGGESLAAVIGCDVGQLLFAKQPAAIQNSDLTDADRAALCNWLTRVWELLPDQSKYSGMNRFISDNMTAMEALPPTAAREKMDKISTDFAKISADSILPDAISVRKRLNLADSLSEGRGFR